MADKNQNKDNWGGGKTSSAYWGQLQEGFAACGSGLSQSPIKLEPSELADLPSLEFQYQDVALEVTHTGSNIEVVIPPGNFMVIANKRFELQQFHFHRPAEHTIKDQLAPLELHLVHKSASGRFAVVGIMLQLGSGNSVIDLVWNQLPADPRTTIRSPLTFNPKDLLPADQGYFQYIGSLTTPPFTEGILWQVLHGSISVRQAQVTQFEKIIGINSRPIQPLNGRKIRISKH